MQNAEQNRKGWRSGAVKLMLWAVLLPGLVACAGGQLAEMEAELAAQELALEQAREDARQQEAARLAAQQAAEEAESERQEALAILQQERREMERVEQRARQEAEQQARAAATLRQQREAAERERETLAQQARLAELETELVALQQQIERRDRANARLSEAVVAAEELLQMLDSEQQKYENVDGSGRTVEPLQKGLIAELEERKNALIREAEALGNN